MGLNSEVKNVVGHGQVEGTLTGRDGAVMSAREHEVDAHITRNSPQPMGIIQGLGEGLGSLHVVKYAFVFPEGKQRITQVQTEINILRHPVVAFRKVLEGIESLLKISYRLSVGRMCHRFGSGLSSVGDGLVPHLTPYGVVGQSLDLLGRPVACERFKGFHDPSVEHTSSFLQ